MNTLVTGASGFVGRHLLRELSGSSDLLVAGAPAASHPAEGVDTMAALRWVDLDMTSAESVRAVVAAYRPQRIYHLAGQSSVALSFVNPLTTWDINATGTLRLLEALRAEGCADARVLLVSSAEVYGYVPATSQPIREGTPAAPTSPYGASKAAAEVVSLQAARHGGLEVVVARSFNHVGPGQDERFILPSVARQLTEIRTASANPVVRVGNLDQWRDFLDVRDVVKAYRCLMEQGENVGVYNVCSGKAVFLADLVHQLVALSGTDARVEIDPDRYRPMDLPRLWGDPTRLLGLGWRSSIPLERTLWDILPSVFG